ncbi:hypothetical protein PTSG_02841 [Salpingoeca rosetta]|uniref:Macro domain-containing protein n=1 Tax=Salpingoeca rosetta (strain ATCC 50818 / BSB-021) TaxID=946362 RepID=F2U3H4_SALR5|nr:uncharacterized protein PTSG_02841 [Salpingoeca rosetta]EGD82168.1 hypothetical protein PTSG_02841 [Salpingoeca rosetta]|eukprot:XP_004996351.1 hypothetical protein PTSG_02841 [Salpingoeca rosetta]
MLLEYSLYYYLDQDRERGLSYIDSTAGANIKSQMKISVSGMQYRFLDSQLLELARRFRVYVRKPSAEDRDACASSVPVTVEGMQRQLTAFDNAVQDTLKQYLCHVLGLPVIDTSHVPEMSESDVTFLKRKLFNYLTKAGRTVCRSKDDVVSYIAPQDVIGTPTERNVWMVAGRRDLMQTVIPTTESTFRTIAHIRPTRYVCQVPMSVTKELKRLRKKALVLMSVIPQARALLRQLQMLLLPLLLLLLLLLATMAQAAHGRQPVNFSAHAVLKGPRMEVVAASEVMLLTTCERLFPAKVKQAVWEVEPYQYHTISETLLAVQLHAEIREGSITNDRDMNAERSGPLAVQRGARDHVRTVAQTAADLTTAYRALLTTARDNNIRSLATCALGCGAFPCSPYASACTLFEVIDEVGRDGTLFDTIRVTIITKDVSMLSAFKQTFEKYYGEKWLYTGPTYTEPPSKAELDNKAAWNGLTHDARLLIENAFNKYHAAIAAKCKRSNADNDG